MRALAITIVAVALLGAELHPATAKEATPTNPTGPTEAVEKKKTEPPHPFSRSAAKGTIKKALTWLQKQQNKDGSYGYKIPIGKDKNGKPQFKEVGDVGITGLVLVAMAESPMALRPGHGPFVSKAVEYLLANVNEDGSIANPEGGLKNYKTSIALMALAAINDEGEYDKVLARGRSFIVGLQASEERGYDPTQHPLAYGGIGYGGDLRPDMSNTVMAAMSLHVTGLEKDSVVWARLVTFVSRSQNSPYNDLDESRTDILKIEDGSLRYSPDETKVVLAPRTGKNKDKKIYPGYLSMTYAGLLSFIYANLDKNDPRVQAALHWITENYSLDENSGLGTRARPTGGADGVYYCRFVMAKALDAYGSPILTTAKGVKHNWAWDLGERLVAQQNEEGWWVNRKSDRWWENNPTLVTSYAALALNLCYKNLAAQEKEVKSLKVKLNKTEKELLEAKTKENNETQIKDLEAKATRLRTRISDLSHPPVWTKKDK